MENIKESLRTAIIKVLFLQYLREKNISYMFLNIRGKDFHDEDIYKSFSFPLLEFSLGVVLGKNSSLKLVNDEILVPTNKYYMYNEEKRNYVLLEKEDDIMLCKNNGIELIELYDFTSEIYQRLEYFYKLIEEADLTEFIRFYHKEVEYQVPLYVGLLFKAMDDLKNEKSIDYMQKNRYSKKQILDFIKQYGQIKSLLVLSEEKKTEKEYWKKTISFIA